LNYFKPIKKWRLPEHARTESFREIARDGKKGNEGIVLWLGRRNKNEATISHLVLLRGPGVIKKPNFLRIESWLLNEVTDITIDLGISIIGQIHSHGSRCGINLSFTDRAYGIAVPYYLSIVVPDYAMRKNTQIAECGVHVFKKNMGYYRLSAKEVLRCIIITPDRKLPQLIVGKE
jgi:hypothetical protein